LLETAAARVAEAVLAADEAIDIVEVRVTKLRPRWLMIWTPSR
jgi:dihydroneopterin aldolase